MTDRELLEQAAKAAGLNYSHEHRDVIDDDHPYGYTWEPLTDDGDALRLAVKLELTVTMNSNGAHATDWSWNNSAVEWFKEHNDDPYAATRRAIVRAAAEIGKDIK